MKTGYIDSRGHDINVGDIVKFRCKGFSLSGKGIVICKDGKYYIQDTRKYPECKSRNEGRMYPFYDNAVYTIVR